MKKSILYGILTFITAGIFGLIYGIIQWRKTGQTKHLGWCVPIVLFFIIGITNPAEDTESTKKEAQNSAISSSSSAKKEETSSEKKAESSSSSKKETLESSSSVSREYKNALKSAENYLKLMAFSKQGLYEQLTSEYGDKFPADAAQYAIDNVKVDWNEEALESAKTYMETMPMSIEALRDQLTSEYGEQFTAEEAEYAIQHLED